MPGRPGQHDQVAAVGQERPQPHLLAHHTGPVTADLPAGEVSELARRPGCPSLHLGLVARRFRHQAAQVQHRGGGHRAQPEQDTPHDVIAGSAAEQGQRDERPDDEPERLGAEHHPDQLAAVLAVGVFAHHHRADRVITANPEPEHEAERDERPE